MRKFKTGEYGIVFLQLENSLFSSFFAFGEKLFSNNGNGVNFN